MIELVVVVAGGAGAACRYLVDGLVQERFGGAFPLGTFVVNVSGSLVLGIVAGRFASHADLPAQMAVVLGAGFVGGYTTFSTWMVETFSLIRGGAWGHAVFNLLGSAVLGVGAAAAGVWIGGSV